MENLLQTLMTYTDYWVGYICMTGHFKYIYMYMYVKKKQNKNNKLKNTGEQRSFSK